MIKILHSTILAFSLLLSFSLQAQDTLLHVTFDDSTLGTFSEFSEVGEGEKWEPRDFGENFFAQMNGYSGSVQENIDWLISPGIDMANYDDEILFFENATNFDGPELELLVSTDYSGSGDPTVATWTDITADATWSPGDYTFVESGNIDLSSYSGTAYIAFKYSSSSSNGAKLYQINRVFVSATSMSSSSNDFEVSDKISTPYVNNDNLTFTVEDSKSITVDICSMNGNTMANYSNKQVSGNVSMPVGDLPSGVYVLIAKSDGTARTYKFVK